MAGNPTYEELRQRVEELERNSAGPPEAEGRPGPETGWQGEGTQENERRQLLSIFDSIDQPIYVSDPDTYEILYVNEVLKASLGDVVGRKCHEALQDMSSPCPFCTNNRIFGENAGRQYIWELRNRTNGRWFHCIDKAIAWPDGRMVRYEMAIDITERKAAEETLSRFFEISPDMICIADLEGTFRFVNPAFEKVLGYSGEELTSTPYINFVHRDDRASTLATSKRVREGVPVLQFENRYRCKDGTYRWLSWKSMPVPEAGITYAIARDVTGRKEAEEAIRESERSYRLLAESLPGIVYRVFIRDNNRMAFFNHMLEPITGYTEAELKRGDVCSIEFLILPEDRDKVLAGIKRAVRENEPFELEYRLRQKNGDIRYLVERGRPIRGPDEMPLYIDGVIFDDTEHKRAEEAVKISERNYREIFDNVNEMIFVHDAKTGAIKDINQAVLKTFGYTKAEMMGLTVQDLSLGEPPFTQKESERLIKKASEEGSLIFEWRPKMKNGDLFWSENNLKRAVIGGDDCILCVARDITERKESERRYRAVVEDMPGMICRFLPDGTLTFVNSAYCNYFGKRSEDLIGQNFFLHVPDDDKEKVRQQFISLNDNRPITTYEHRVIAPDGTIHYQEWTDRALFDDKGRLKEYQSVGRDISEAKLAQQEKAEIEKQLQQAQKMQAIGTLAGGIAHDFNNILGAIIGYTDLARSDVPADDPIRYHLEQILQGGYRARDLVKQILAFSRQTEQEKRPIRIGPIVKETAKLLRASLPATIEIKTEIETDTDLVVGDPTQIHQVLMNLCTNAGHAMREGGGILRIGMQMVDLDSRSAVVSPDLTEGPYLRIEVSDTGHGICPEVMERIFDPYFTTKEKGEGTGLGLAAVHGIVKNHGGAVRVSSEPDKYTTFHVYLPRVAAVFEHGGEEASTIPGGNECVLFVDDEVVLVNLARNVLKRLGYEVVTRTSSIEALEVFRTEPDRFDVVVTDHTMPNLTGVELARKLMAIRPGIPIILCTGFSEQINPEKARALGFSEFLLKPLLIPDLSRAIRRALNKDL